MEFDWLVWPMFFSYVKSQLEKIFWKIAILQNWTSNVEHADQKKDNDI